MPPESLDPRPSALPARIHRYRLHLRWTGANGHGTTGYGDYRRDHILTAAGKPDLAGSSDPAFRGDPARWSPEELLLGALSACHQLWYLHLCAAAGIVVLAYEDNPEAVMHEEAGGAGQFHSVTLRPLVTIDATGDRGRAAALHADAASHCFIARSVNFPVLHEATLRGGQPAG